jgi:4-hydroxybenzoate polyprenyltransferase
LNSYIRTSDSCRDRILLASSIKVTSFFSFIRLIRPINILIIVAALYLIRYCIIVPLLGFEGNIPSMSIWIYSGWILTAVLTAASGNVINDLKDLKTDALNKPHKLVIGKTMDERTATIFYLSLCIVSLGFSFWLSWKSGIRFAAGLNALTIVLLWLYSARLKCTPVAGNVLISLLTSSLIFLAGYIDAGVRANESAMTLLTGYAVFAFTTSMSREIIKDLEDAGGDRNVICKTLAVQTKPVVSKIICALFLFITLVLLGYVQYQQILSADYISLGYVSVAIQVPLVIAIILLMRSRDKMDHHRISNWIKYVMCTGILSMLVFYLSY